MAFYPQLLTLKDEIEELNRERQALTIALSEPQTEYTRFQNIERYVALMSRLGRLMEGAEELMEVVEAEIGSVGRDG